eukprot:10646607-Alexandrium_andersonii.AAC.1
MLVNLKQSGVLSAKQSCILAFWAHRAGASGVKDLAHRPGLSHTGHYSRHFDSVCGTRTKDALPWYEVPIPLHHRWDAGRVVDDVSTLVAHECFDADFRGGDAA